MDLRTGEKFNLVSGTHLQNVEVFAGKGSKAPYKQAQKFADKYGGKANQWQHAKGTGLVDYYGEEREAEIHWFQEKSVGKHKFKIKRWRD